MRPVGMTIDPSWVSDKRFAEYVEAAGGDLELASRLYEWNAHVSSALFELIHHVEVLLRNAIITTLARNGAGPGVPPGTPWVQNAAKIDEVVGRLRRLEKEPTEARVYANLTFGFWQSMFNAGYEYDELWVHALQFAFPRGKIDRKTVAAYLQSINLLRNRIAHHGSLIERDTLVESKKMLSLASWIDTDAAAWLRSIERVSAVSASRPVAPRRNVVVVAAEQAWNLYSDLKQSVYVFQAARSIQLVEYVAFYSDQEIKPVVPKILGHFPAVDWNKANSRRLIRSADSMDNIVGAAIATSMGQGWNETSYQVFVLSTIKSDESVKLSAAVNHSRRGAGSAFVRAHRYLPLTALTSARDTSDLEK